MPLDKSNDRIQQMFGEIAPRYDFLNHLLSLGIDLHWRRQTVRRVRPEGTAPVLDLCAGTGDLALAYFRHTGGARRRRSWRPIFVRRCWRSAAGRASGPGPASG